MFVTIYNSKNCEIKKKKAVFEDLGPNAYRYVFKLTIFYIW